MIEKTLAKRYARALLSLSDRAGATEAIEAEILGLKAFWQGTPKVRSVLLHPKVSRPEKAALLDKALEGRVHPLVRELLHLLVEKGRLSYLPEIADQFDQLADESHGVVRVQVASFLPLTTAQQEALSARMSARTGKKVDLRYREDRSLKGGMAVRLGDQVMDGSVATRLKRLKEELELAVRA